MLQEEAAFLEDDGGRGRDRSNGAYTPLASHLT
jgi:hypothetical protein